MIEVRGMSYALCVCLVIAERRERSEANNRVLFEIPRYLYIYICLSASALCKTVHTLRKSYHVGCCAFGTLAAVRRTTLRSRPFVRYGRRCQFSVFLTLSLLHAIHVPCHIHHLAYCTYSHFPLSLLCYYSSIKFINNCCMIEVRGMSYALCVCLVI